MSLSRCSPFWPLLAPVYSLETPAPEEKADSGAGAGETRSGSTQASTTPALSGTIAAGTYCVAVFDAGNQSAPVDYSLTLVHY